METRDRRVPIALGVILGVALALRLAYVLGQRRDLLFDYPVVDEETYVAMARRLANGATADPRAWFQPPGLVYALGAVFRVCGPGLLAPRLVQAVVSTASCALAFVTARRLFSAPVALATASVLALHGAMVFESYELLPPTWMLASDLVALWALLRAKERATPLSALGAGMALGVAGVFGPTVLPFALVAAGLLRRPVLAAAFMVGVALPIAPVTWGNWERAHEVVLVSTNGSVNLYIGNNERYLETLAIRPGPHWDALQDHPRPWFLQQVLAFWGEHPARELALYARKLYLYFDGPEIPRDTDIYAMRRDSALLGLLVTRGPPWLPDGLLVPLALVGAGACWPDRRRLAPLYGFAAAQALVVAAFFVTSRYRVPALPVLAMLACAGVARIAAAARRARSAAAGAFALLALALNVETHESSVSYGAELDFYRGEFTSFYRHDPAQAILYFQRATAADDADARSWFELGNAFAAVGRGVDAVSAWRRAAQIDPWDARPRRRMATVLAQNGDLDGAIDVLREDIDTRTHEESFYASDHLSLALLCARRGFDTQAVDELAAARVADPAWFRANIARFARAVAAAPDLHADFRDAVASADADARRRSP